MDGRLPDRRLDRLRLALEYYEERQFGFIGCMRTGMIVSDPKEMNYEPDHVRGLCTPSSDATPQDAALSLQLCAHGREKRALG